ncbi:MAG: class I SAM-dependent methyltransferase [Chloroflexi bacterium]|nr:class I SAM-dependent methyltransferase [Chloroflexota bacterium]
MFRYGRVYARLSERGLAHLVRVVTGRPLAVVGAIRAYVRWFGYPDVAGQVRFGLVSPLLRFAPGDRLLDAGCGNGLYALELATTCGVPCVGVDLKAERLVLAQHLARDLRAPASFSRARVTELGFPAGTFSHVLLIEVLEHIRSDRAALAEIHRVLRPGGQLILTVPREDPFTANDLHTYAHAEEGAHVRHGYERDALAALLESTGFRVELWQPYYRWFTKWTVRAQQLLHQRYGALLNVATYPLLRLLSGLDLVAGRRRAAWHRGQLVVATR